MAANQYWFYPLCVLVALYLLFVIARKLAKPSSSSTNMRPVLQEKPNVKWMTFSWAFGTTLSLPVFLLMESSLTVDSALGTYFLTAVGAGLAYYFECRKYRAALHQ